MFHSGANMLYSGVNMLHSCASLRLETGCLLICPKLGYRQQAPGFSARNYSISKILVSIAIHWLGWSVGMGSDQSLGSA